MKNGEEGKEFAPDQKVHEEDEATVEEGSGKQFSPGTDDPDHDPQARRQRGSGKQFSPSVGPPDSTEPGTGKEFAAGQQTPDRPRDPDDATDPDHS